MMLSTMLLMALMASAQTKVAPKLAKGDKKTYVAETVASLNGQKEVKKKSVTDYKVIDQTATGFVLECTTTSFESDADKTDLMGRVMGISEEMMKGVSIRLVTDKDGRITGIQNFDEVSRNIKNYAGKLIDELLESIPQVPVSKDDLVKQVTGGITEAMLVETFQGATSPLALSGKTIAIGAQDDYTSNGMKMKRMYFPNTDGTITTTGSLNMSKDQMKQLIIDQLTKMAPDQAEMVKQNIDLVMQSVKIEMSEKAVYTLQADGWVKSIKSESNNDAMGQKISLKTTVTLQP